MSDLKAKAEARRAKILAREKNQVKAIGDNIALPTDDTKSRVRPLANRRKLVTKAPVEEIGEKEDIKSNSTKEEIHENNTSKGSTNDKEKSEIVSETSDPSPIKEPESPSNSSTSKSETKEKSEVCDSESKKKKSYSIKDIEKEIAENTAKFDSKTLKKEKDPEKENLEKIKKESFIKKNLPEVTVNNIQPTSILRFIRLLVILFVGAYLGYNAANFNRNYATQVLNGSLSTYQYTSTQVSSSTISGKTQFQIDEFSEEGVLETPSASIMRDSTYSDFQNDQSNSWAGWAKNKIRKQMECSISATGMIWWLTGLFSPIVTLRFKQPAKKSSFMDWLNIDIKGYLFSYFGELSFHLFSLILFTLLFTISSVHPFDENNSSPGVVDEL